MTDRPIIGFDFGTTDGAVIVVTVQPDGSYRVQADDVCKSIAAELLHGIADRLRAEHPPYPCKPAPGDRRPDEGEAANPYAGRLDRERQVWRDGRGDSFDLTLTWLDQTDSAWRWQGTVGQFGEPILMCEDGETQPFGVLRALYGPLMPQLGGAA
ncbi:phiSA1p31-related protein [Streptomyces sp. NPDC006172]|uniref:phiSA1p31-related protein n=1 Tax=Streptomyces sp. NPDC006172 TaxID=3154470 RepID=UPI0033CC8677